MGELFFASVYMFRILKASMTVSYMILQDAGMHYVQNCYNTVSFFLSTNLYHSNSSLLELITINNNKTEEEDILLL